MPSLDVLDLQWLGLFQKPQVRLKPVRKAGMEFCTFLGRAPQPVAFGSHGPNEATLPVDGALGMRRPAGGIAIVVPLLPRGASNLREDDIVRSKIRHFRLAGVGIFDCCREGL